MLFLECKGASRVHGVTDHLVVITASTPTCLTSSWFLPESSFPHALHGLPDKLTSLPGWALIALCQLAFFSLSEQLVQEQSCDLGRSNQNENHALAVNAETRFCLCFFLFPSPQGQQLFSDYNRSWS